MPETGGEWRWSEEGMVWTCLVGLFGLHVCLPGARATYAFPSRPGLDWTGLLCLDCLFSFFPTRALPDA